MKYFKIIVVALCLGLLYALYAFFLRQGHVSTIYQYKEYNKAWKAECRSTVVLVDDVPLSEFSLKRMWWRNSKEIIKKWEPFKSDCDDILFVNNKTSSPYYKSELTYWIGDSYICLNGALKNKKCISKEEQLFVIQMRQSTLADEKVGMVNRNPIYIHYINYGG